MTGFFFSGASSNLTFSDETDAFIRMGACSEFVSVWCGMEGGRGEGGGWRGGGGGGVEKRCKAQLRHACRGRSHLRSLIACSLQIRRGEGLGDLVTGDDVR